jgi:hypothetical protein
VCVVFTQLGLLIKIVHLLYYLTKYVSKLPCGTHTKSNWKWIQKYADFVSISHRYYLGSPWLLSSLLAFQTLGLCQVKPIYLKATYCRSISTTGLLEPLAPCGGMSDPLAPREMTSINSKGRFLTISVPLPPLVFSASLGWLILSTP